MNFISIFSVFSSFKCKMIVNKGTIKSTITTLEDFVDNVLKGVSESTKGNYYTAMRSFHRFNKGKDIALSGITTDKVKVYKWWLCKQGVYNNTILCYLYSLRSIYNKGVRAGKYAM